MDEYLHRLMTSEIMCFPNISFDFLISHLISCYLIELLLSLSNFHVRMISIFTFLVIMCT